MKLTREERQEIREARAALLATYAANRDGKTPAQTIDAAIKENGYDRTKTAIASMVIAKGSYDQRISANSREWAKDAAEYSREDLAEAGIYYCDEIHPAHMEQLTRAFREAPAPAP